MPAAGVIGQKNFHRRIGIVVLGLASSMIMLTARGLASSSGDKGKKGLCCEICIVALGLASSNLNVHLDMPAS